MMTPRSRIRRSTSRNPRRHIDIFQVMAIVLVMTGWLIVITASAFGELTGRAPTVIFGAGLGMITIGFGLDRLADSLGQFLRQAGEYEPPPQEMPARDRDDRDTS